MNYEQLKNKLDIRLGDSDNFAFTVEEKAEALTEAFNSQHAVVLVEDNSLTFSAGTYQYTKPSGVDTIKDIFIKPDNDQDEPVKISANLWEVVNNHLNFKNGARRYITDGTTLYIKGHTKLTIASTVTDVNLQEFILNQAQLHCLNQYGTKKALKFIKNDTSMAEIVTFKRELERKVAGYIARLPRSYESA